MAAGVSWVSVLLLVPVEPLVLVDIQDDSLVAESEAQLAVLETLGDVFRDPWDHHHHYQDHHHYYYHHHPHLGAV